MGHHLGLLARFRQGRSRGRLAVVAVLVALVGCAGAAEIAAPPPSINEALAAESTAVGAAALREGRPPVDVGPAQVSIAEALGVVEDSRGGQLVADGWSRGIALTVEDLAQIEAPAPVPAVDSLEGLELPPPASVDDRARAAELVVVELLEVWWFDPPPTWWELAGETAHLTTGEFAAAWAAQPGEVPATSVVEVSELVATRTDGDTAAVSVTAEHRAASGGEWRSTVVVHLVDIGGWRVEAIR